MSTLVEAGIIDPTKVVCVALENAASVASVLLLAEAIMIEVSEPRKERLAKRRWRSNPELRANRPVTHRSGERVNTPNRPFFGLQRSGGVLGFYWENQLYSRCKKIVQKPQKPAIFSDLHR
jgi:hypothetical protein